MSCGIRRDLLLSWQRRSVSLAPILAYFDFLPRTACDISRLSHRPIPPFCPVMSNVSIVAIGPRTYDRSRLLVLYHPRVSHSETKLTGESCDKIA